MYPVIPIPAKQKPEKLFPRSRIKTTRENIVVYLFSSSQLSYTIASVCVNVYRLRVLHHSLNYPARVRTVLKTKTNNSSRIISGVQPKNMFGISTLLMLN